MKRCAILAIMLVGLSTVCTGQHRFKASQLKIIQLPEPKLTGSAGLEQLLVECKSVYKFTTQPLDFIQIGQLAWAGCCAMEPEGETDYPIKLYFAIREGIFLYDPRLHCLEEAFIQDIRGKLAEALKQESVANAPCCIIIAGSARRPAAKTVKYTPITAGRIAQNIRLQAVGLGLASAAFDDFNIIHMRKICRLSADLEPIYIICLGFPIGQTAEEKTEQKSEEETQTAETDNEETKKAILIIASQNFRDEELFETKKELENANIETTIASTKTGIIKGTQRGKAEAVMLINDIVVEDYDAVIFVGGPGAREYFDSTVAADIARQAKNKEKVLAAICIAPAVLANAGVLDGVKATSFSTEQYKLKKAGAEYTGADVERDGLIITANGPRVAAEFGKTIVEAITGEQ